MQGPTAFDWADLSITDELSLSLPSSFSHSLAHVELMLIIARRMLVRKKLVSVGTEDAAFEHRLLKKDLIRTLGLIAPCFQPIARDNSLTKRERKRNQAK